MKLEDFTGQTFGYWTVIYRIKSDRNKATVWMCRCICGIEKSVYGSHLKYGKSQSCGCVTKTLCQNKHHSWTGHGDISGSFWKDIQSGAKVKRRREIEFSITIEHVWELFLKQNKKCAISGIELCMNFEHKKYSNRNNQEHTASLDRIDSSLGYIEGNVQWVHKDVNMMKRTYDQTYFINFCKKIAEFNK